MQYYQSNQIKSLIVCVIDIPRLILMRSARADVEPIDQHEPQYCGICWLRVDEQKLVPLTLRQSQADGTATCFNGLTNNTDQQTNHTLKKSKKKSGKIPDSLEKSTKIHTDALTIYTVVETLITDVACRSNRNHGQEHDNGSNHDGWQTKEGKQRMVKS
jgi:hypothetical protein